MLTLCGNNSRGAMFGLDARIALAIFAGLATVTGATLYKLSSQSRVTAMVAELNNISKAFGDYVVDVGASPDKIEDLITSSAPGWNGPYLSYTDNSVVANQLNVVIGGDVQPLAIMYSTDATNDAENMPDACTASNCWGWVNVGGNHTFLMPLDKAIDGTDDSTNGRFRYEASVPNDSEAYFRLGSVRQR